MKKSWHKFVLVWLLLPVTAHADREIERDDFSGWMQVYDGLVYHENRNAFIFIDEAKRGSYTKVRLESVTVYSKNADGEGEIALKSSRYLEQGMRALLQRVGVDAEQAGPGVLDLRIAITGVEKSKEALKAYHIIPVAAVFRGAQEATGNVTTYIDTMLEGEMTDSVSGERVVAIVARGIEETEKRSGDELGFEDVRPTLDKWLLQYEETLADLLARQPAEPQ